MAVRIDVPINISAEFLGEAILDAAIGKFEKLEAVTKLGSGKTKPFDYEFKFSSTGEKIFTAIPGQLRQIDSAYEGAVAAAKKFTNTQDGSLTSLRQSVNNLKQQRDAINKTNPEWAGLNRRVLEGEAVLREYMGVQKGSIAYLQQQKNVLLETARNENLTGDARYKHTQAINAQNAALRAAQGIQKGSLADLKAQRAEILALRDATRKLPNLNGPPDGPGGGPTWNQLNAQLKDIDGQINRLTPSFSRLVRALGTIATVQAGFVAVTSALSGLGSLVNSYTARQKDIESFNLALRNIGLTQAETTKYFKEAASTANALGAPVQQVEKSYKRMLPALRAVGATSEESSRFIEQITARTQTLGLNTEQSGRLLEAFAQVLSKGKLQSEELNQQISELDGAFRTQLAEAIGVTSEQLNKLIEEGAVTSDVFVKAVNKMANGAEELKKRVEEGTATIQQLQNNINNISVDTLGKIGKQIEPLIKSFLRIATSVAEFFNEFQRTEVFKLFVTVLNQAAKGVEIFVKTLLNLVSTVATLLSPVASIANAILGLGESFGGVIGIIINVIGGLVTLKGAIMALNAIKSSAESISKFSGEMTKLGSASQEAAARVSGIRGVFRGLSDLGGGIAGKLLQMTNGFLGISTAAKKAEQDLGGIRTVADMQAASIGQLTAAHMDLSLKLKEGKITTEDAQKALDGLNAQQKNNGETTQQTKRKIIEYGMSMDEGTAKTDKFTGSTQKAGTGLTNLGTQARATGAAIKGVLAESFIALVNPITLAIQLVGKFIQVLEAQKKAAESVDASFSDVYLGLQRTLDETAPKGQKVTKSVEQTSASLDKQNKQVESTGNAWKTAGVILGGVALVAGTVLTGGILAAGYAAGASGAALISAGVAAVGFKTVAAGTAITLGSMALSAEASKKAIENLEKSGQGKALLENYKRVDQQLGAVRARIQGLGQDINSTDFSKYAEGSVNLGLLEKSYGGLTASLRENIELEKQRLSELAKSGKLTDAERAAIEARIAKYETELKLREQQLEAVRSEIALRIAQGKAVDASTLSLEELNRAQKLVNDAIDVEKIRAQTAALRQYGSLQADQYALAAANLGIEAGASEQRLRARQQELALLEEKQRLNGTLSAEEKAKALELTQTIAEEGLKQQQIQQQLGQAIVDAFERGIRSGQKLGDIAGEIKQKYQGIFEGVTSSLQSGIQAAIGYLDIAIQNETFGLKENSEVRKRAILFQLRITAEMNNLEYQVAKLKLDTSYRVAQNEARIAQLRYKAEAEIAAARGDMDLAAAYNDAANAQGKVMEGLKDQYVLDQQILRINKSKSDQTLVQRGLQAGIGDSAQEVADRIGVQYKNTQDVVKEMRSLDATAKQIQTKWANITEAQSNYQVSVERGAGPKGAAEAEKVAKAFDDARNNINNATTATGGLVNKFRELSKYTDKVQKDMQVMNRLANGPSPRAMGGPVSPGGQYLVNDGGGREGFLNKFGRFSLLPPGRNIRWSPPTTGTVIPAGMTSRVRENSSINNKVHNINVNKSSVNTTAATSGSSLNPGTLLKQMAASVSNNTSSRVTNNVTIQSQKPVADASQIMTDLAKIKLRSSRRSL